MHPSISIICFLIFSGYIAFGSFLNLLLAAGLLIILYTATRFRYLKSGWLILRRMRWLFLSILIIYLWFTPGRPLLSALADSSPTIEGLQLGLMRAAALVAIVLAVNITIKPIPRPKLISSILWLLQPLQMLGLPHERLAIRIAMTFENIDEVQKLFESQSKQTTNEAKLTRESYVDRFRGKISTIGGAAQSLFIAVLERAYASPIQEIQLHDQEPPAIMQWIYPVLLLLMFNLLSWFNLHF